MRDILSISIDKKLKKKVETAARVSRISKSEIVREALEKYLVRKEFSELREKLIPYAEKAGIYSDEDIFKKIS